MTCPDENVLGAFVERNLSQEEWSEVEAHLDGCTQCLSIVSEIARADSTLPSSSSTWLDPGVRADSARNTTLRDADRETVTDAALEKGALVGRYTVLDILGEGGMGTVYLAHDPELDRRVALKVLRRAKLGAASGRRLTTEARIMARLVHPNIVTVFDAGEVRGRTYLAMEMLDGGTLTDWLRAERRPDGAIVEMFVVAGRALAAAHDAGVVHRDFKPANVLLDRKGRVAVADFGIAASFASDENDVASSPRAARAVSGTPAYMSPEQRRGEPVGPASDQYSFAVSLHEALAGNRPGRAAPVIDVTDLAPPWRAPLQRALSIDPADRFPSMTELVAALERGRRPPRRLALRMLGASAVALVVVTAALAAFARSRAGDAAAAVLASPSAASSSPPAAAIAAGARTAVVVLPFDNRTGDPRLDGVMEAALTTFLSASRHLDAYSVANLRSLAPPRAADAGPVDDDTLAREMQDREERPVVLLRGTSMANADSGAGAGGITLALTATDVTSGRTVTDFAQPAPSSAALVATAPALTGRLRAALGDVPPADEEPPPRLSTSLPALHDWAQGRALLDGKSELAVPVLERAVRADPAFAAARSSLGFAYASEQNGPAAKREMDLALRSPEGFTERGRLSLLAASYDADGRAAEAISVDEELLSLWPRDASTEVNMAATALRMHEWPLALELSRRAVANHPGSLAARADVLIALIANGHFNEASSAGVELLRTTERPTVYTFVLLALAHALEGDRDEALAVYDRLAPLDDELADEGRADLAMYEGRLDDAEPLLQRHIAAAIAGGDPSDGRTEYRSLALCRLRRGDRAGAVTAARAGLGNGTAAEAGAVEVQYSLASTLVESGSEKEALGLSRRWDEHPSAVWRAYAKALAGDIALRRGRPAEALESYQAARHLSDEWRMHERLGEAYLARRDWERAAQELSTCWERRGEAATIETPSLQYLVPVVQELALARAHLDAGAVPRSAPAR